MSKAKDAASEMKIMFDYKPQIDTWSTDGLSVDSMQEHIEFGDVHFRYPARPD